MDNVYSTVDKNIDDLKPSIDIETQPSIDIENIEGKPSIDIETQPSIYVENIEGKPSIDIENIEGSEYLSKIKNNSIDLILIDPPYITSRDSGMNKKYNELKKAKVNGNKYIKTEQEWTLYKQKHSLDSDESKETYMKYGTSYGDVIKYSVKTDYGDWDKNFHIDKLEQFIKTYYDKLKKGGTIIIFFDIWKLSYLKELLEKYKFKQIRFIEWIKNNPAPINSKINYLTNCREIALTAIKDKKPTFNSKYDKGIYNFPIESGKNKFHPTQKNIKLITELIYKHSNEGDTVLDTFLGSGTTAAACKLTNRNFKGCELSKEYYDKLINRVSKM